MIACTCVCGAGPALLRKALPSGRGDGHDAGGQADEWARLSLSISHSQTHKLARVVFAIRVLHQTVCISSLGPIPNSPSGVSPLPVAASIHHVALHTHMHAAGWFTWHAAGGGQGRALLAACLGHSAAALP